MSISDAELAVAAAEAGAAVVLAKFGSTLERLDKGRGDFATEADVEAERAILAILRRARPGDGVLGEESGRFGSADAGRVWLVDPLCGTLNYAARTMAVAVNVALREGDQIVAAAVADPFAGEVFWTDGRATYLRRIAAETGDGNSDETGDGDETGEGLPDGTGHRSRDEQVFPSAETGLVDVNLDPPFEIDGRIFGDSGFRARFRPRVLSTTLALAWVAVGRRAGYLTRGDMRDNVHFTAGIALCRAAGCVVTGLDGRSIRHAPAAEDRQADGEADHHTNGEANRQADGEANHHTNGGTVHGRESGHQGSVPAGLLAAADPDVHAALLAAAANVASTYQTSQRGR